MSATRLAEPLAETLFRRRLARGKEDAARRGERFGIAGQARPTGRLVWIHAASVGESLSILALIDSLMAQCPTFGCVLTTGTVSSTKVIQQRLPKGVLHQYLPYDFPAGVNRFLDHWRPEIGIWTESELWPRLIHETHRRQVPMVLANARISERSERRWRRLPSLAAALGSRFDLVLAQDDAIAERFRQIGWPAERISVAGTLRQDASPLPVDDATLSRLRRVVGGRPVWLAASTHQGEDSVIAQAHARILGTHPNALLILAPRHPERRDEVAAALRRVGLAARLRSQAALPSISEPAYIADSLGEMGLWYRLAPVSFIGGSLIDVGGHNPFEPLRLGSAIICGPDMRNFADIHRQLRDAGALREASDATAIADAVRDLFKTDIAATQLARARQFAHPDQAHGPVARTVREILARLDQDAPLP